MIRQVLLVCPLMSHGIGESADRSTIFSSSILLILEDWNQTSCAYRFICSTPVCTTVRSSVVEYSLDPMVLESLWCWSDLTDWCYSMMFWLIFLRDGLTRLTFQIRVAYLWSGLK